MEDNTISKKIDYPTVIIFLILVIFGWMNIFSSSYSGDEVSVFDLDLRAGKQMIWIVVSLLLIIPLLFLETHIISFFSYLVYGIVIVLLIAVLVFGTAVNQSLSWFEIAGIRIQPAEFAKFATALALAKYMGREQFTFRNIKDTLIAGGIVLLPALLILLQNDTGSAMVFSVFLLVFYREGLHFIFLFLAFFFTALFILNFYLPNELVFLTLSIALFALFAYFSSDRIIFFKQVGVFILTALALLFGVVVFRINAPNNVVILISTFAGGLYFFARHNRMRLANHILAGTIYIVSIGFIFSVNYFFDKVLSDYQRDRIDVFLGILDAPKGVGYNVHQSEIAIGSGGFSGKGYLQGTQTKFDFVPEQDTDFIFCTVGEEWGFIGSTITLILFGILIYRFIIIAERQRTRFSRVFGYSVAALFFFHFGVNIAMTIGLAPVIGIPLPFISYGGSSLWAFTLLLFTLLRLDMSREELL